MQPARHWVRIILHSLYVKKHDVELGQAEREQKYDRKFKAMQYMMKLMEGVTMQPARLWMK